MGYVAVMQAVINADCTVTYLPAVQTTVAAFLAGHRPADRSRSITGTLAQPLKRVGTPDPDFHIVNQLQDPIGLVLTELDTDFSWTTDGSVITSGSGNNTAHWHVESSCVGDSGWHLQSLTGGQGGGGVGYASATWTGHAEWSYMGTFSACDPNLYYNIFDNSLTGYANGSPSYCSYSQYARHTYSGWRFYVYCYAPTQVLEDYRVP